MTTLSQLKTEVLKDFRETCKHSQFVDYSRIEFFIAEAIDTAVRTGFRETRIKDKELSLTEVNNGFSALAEKTCKEEEFINN